MALKGAMSTPAALMLQTVGAVEIGYGLAITFDTRVKAKSIGRVNEPKQSALAFGAKEQRILHEMCVKRSCHMVTRFKTSISLVYSRAYTLDIIYRRGSLNSRTQRSVCWSLLVELKLHQVHTWPAIRLYVCHRATGVWIHARMFNDSFLDYAL